MSILKAKIAFIQQKKRESESSTPSKDSNFSTSPETKEEKKVLPSLSLDVRFNEDDDTMEEDVSEPSPTSSNASYRCSKKKKADPDRQSSNNIMKNYCRGIANFAVSQMAIPYLTPLLKSHSLELETFRKFIRNKKNKINCIKQLREMLLVAKKDKPEVIAMKNIFKEITIVFLKYFTPNWVYHSKISDKYAHLKYRFKILRRVKNPVYFTYLQDFNS